MTFLAGFTKIRNSNLLDSRIGAEVIFKSLSASIQRLTNISAPPPRKINQFAFFQNNGI
jgi:hypothetical protein